MNLAQWATPKHRVIHEAPAQGRIKDRRGNPVLYRQIRELLLDDGSTQYGCAHCLETSPDLMVVFRHLKDHKPRSGQPPKKARGKPAPPPAPPPEVNGHKTNGGLAMEVLDREIAKLTEQRDRYKSRALKAERQLAKVRRDLGVGIES